MRTHDWSSSPLGPPETWPQSLRSVVGLLLGSKFPMFVAWGPELGFLYNDPYAEILGAKHPASLGARFYDIWSEIWPDILPLIDAAMAGEATFREDLPLLMNRRGYDEQTWFTFSYSPVRDESGRVAGMFCAVQETTDRVLAHRRLHGVNETLEARVAEALAERKVFADIVEGTDAFVQVADLDYRWLAINNAAANEFERIFGVRPKVGDSMLDLLADQPEHRAQVEAVWRRALAGEEFTQIGEFGDPGRDRRFYEMKFNVLRGASDEPVGASQYVVDVTERLRDQARLRTIFETSHQLQGLLALDGTLLEANATSLAVIEATAEDVVGKLFWETPWFTGTPGLPETVRRAFTATIARGSAFREEINIDLRGGRRSFDFSMRPVRDARGAIVAVVPEAVETTSRRAAEEALRQAQKMETVGHLTGGLAHDFNNLLTGVLGNLELLETRFGADEDARKLVQAAARGAARGAQLTEQLLVFARKQHLEAKATDLNAAVRGMTDMLRRTVGAGRVQVKTALTDDLWPALVDATQIEVALLNLAINARDAMPLGGTIRIVTRNVAAANDRDRPSDLSPGDYVVVAVTDTGEGMSPEIAEKAFDPFFTTKELGKGTGLGLSQVYGLVRQSAGTARIRSKPGAGTTVEIYLPRAPEVSRVGNHDLPAAQRRRSQTVLVIDDQDDVREVVVAQLEELGHRAVAAPDGRLGLDLLTAVGANNPIDLLLVDYAMPGLSGPEVARAARQARPHVPIVLMTGYADTRSLAEPPPPDVVLLKKPFKMQQLAEALEAATLEVRVVEGGAKVIPLVHRR
jgi:PAS domain S-box-containing protein